jgi:addiction module HigA family antidote
MNKRLQAERELLSPPGDDILETIEHLKMTQAELAARLGKTTPKVNDLISGKEPITLKTALQLEKVLGISAEYWMNREARYRTKLARIEEEEQAEANLAWVKNMPLKELHKAGYIVSAKATHETLSGVLRFFGVASVQAWQNVYEVEVNEMADYRKSATNQTTIASVAAWLRLGELAFQQQSIVPFNKQKFKEDLEGAIRELAATQPDDYASRLQQLAAASGVAVIFTPSFSKAPLCGATRWIDGNPVIQLTDRYKTNDQFWFTFYHEAGHVLKHGKKEIFIEPEKGHTGKDTKEEEANAYASEILLPKSAHKALLALPTGHTIVQLAETYQIHPGIVVGRFQHLTKNFTKYNDLKVKIKLPESLLATAKKSRDLEETQHRAMANTAFAGAWADDEPEYSEADIIEKNPNYEG